MSNKQLTTALALLTGVCFSINAQDNDIETKNKQIITVAFESWSHGSGDFFSLLSDNLKWTITGTNPIAKTYTSPKQFMDEAIVPLNKKLQVKIVPKVLSIVAEGDMVVVLWEGHAVDLDGLPYDNKYSWHMKMLDGKIISAVAFFDSAPLVELYRRIP